MIYEKQLAGFGSLSPLPHVIGEQLCDVDKQTEEYIKWSNLSPKQARELIAKLKEWRPSISKILPVNNSKKQEVIINKEVVSRSIVRHEGETYSIMVCAKPKITHPAKTSRSPFNRY